MEYGESVPTTSVSIGFGILSISIVIISLIISIVMLISLIKIFTRNGKPGWGVIIPIYNFILMSEIAEVKSIYVILLFVPIVNIYARYVIYKGIAKKYNKSSGYAVGMLLVPFIFFPMLAFKKEDDTLNVNNNVNNNQFQGEIINNQEVIQPIQGQPSVTMMQEVPVNMGMPSVEQVNNVGVVPPVMPQETPVSVEVQNSVPSVDKTNNVGVMPEVVPEEAPVSAEVKNNIPSVEQANNVGVVPPVMPQETPVSVEVQNSVPSVDQTNNIGVMPEVVPEEAPVSAEVKNNIPSVDQTNNVGVMPEVVPEEAPVSAEMQNNIPSVEQVNNVSTEIPASAEVQTSNEDIEEL